MSRPSIFGSVLIFYEFYSDALFRWPRSHFLPIAKTKFLPVLTLKKSVDCRNNVLGVSGSLFGPSDDKEEFVGFEAHEIPTNSDVEEFFDGGSDEEIAGERRGQNNDRAVNWSSNLSQINVEEFVENNGPTHDLGVNARRKISSTFSLMIRTSTRLCAIPWRTLALAATQISSQPVKKFRNFCLNIFMGIHKLSVIADYWDNDIFIRVEGFKKTMSRNRFMEIGKYLDLMDPSEEDTSDPLTKVRSLVDLLKDRFP